MQLIILNVNIKEDHLILKANSILAKTKIQKKPTTQ